MIDYLQKVNDLIGPILNAMPYPVFIVDEDVKIFGLNKASKSLLGDQPELIIKRRAGEILHCIHSYESIEGCGRSHFCSDCIIRNSVNKAFENGITTREKAKVEIINKGVKQESYLSIIVSPFDYDEKRYILMQLENMTEVMELRKLLPICSVCHKIRNDDDYWHRIESYLGKYLDLNFSHSICPECIKQVYPDLDF